MTRYDINLRDYWRIIRKRRTIVILSTVLFTVFSYLFALIRTPEPLYEATSAVKVEKASNFASLLLGTVSWTNWDNVSTQAVIITSFPVLEAAARRMGSIPENVSSAEARNNNKYLRIVTNLKSQVQTTQEGNTNIINITATAAIAAVGSSPGYVLLAPERNAAVASVSRSHCDPYRVDEHGSERRPP